MGSGTQTEFSASAATFGLVMGTIFALPLGVAQWLVVRRSLSVGKRWIVATALGVGVMHALGDGLPAPWGWGPAGLADGWLAVGTLGGLGIGILQVLASPGRISPASWVVANAIAWPFGIVTGLWLAYAVGLMAQSGPGAWAQQHLLVSVIAGLTVGVVTGALLTRSGPLMRWDVPAA